MNAIPNCCLRTLLVDDDGFTREFAETLLREMGVRTITTAADGLEGLAAYDTAQVKPDLVLCDLHMPGHDGFQMMEALAKRNYQGGVILISGQDQRVLQSAGLMARFHHLQILGTLSKPVDKDAMGSAIAKLQPAARR